jgi:hypothetical protein
MKNKNISQIFCIFLLIALVASAILATTNIPTASALMSETTITLKSGSTIMVFSPSDLYAMPSYTGVGAVRSSGNIQSFGNYTGIPMNYLCNLIGGMASDSSLKVVASDGYQTTYTYGQIYNNDWTIYNSSTNQIIHPTDTTLILAYAWNGSSGPDYYNAPRILLVSPLSNYPNGVAIFGNSVPKNVTSIEIINPPSTPLAFKTCDNTGTATSNFASDNDVYFTANGLLASTAYSMYVVQDVNWGIGMTIPTRVSGTTIRVTTNSSGGINPTNIYTNAQAGKYDIVIDTNNNGIFDGADLLIDNVVTTAGLFVLPEYVYGACSQWWHVLQLS